MADEMLKEIFFNAGEGVIPDDFNDLQRQLNALAVDGLSAHMGHNLSLPLGAHSQSDLIWSYGLAGACYDDTASGDWAVAFREGPIIQYKGTAVTGDEPVGFFYYLRNADIPDKLRPAATTNPRWDVLSVEFSETTDNATSRDFKDAVTGALSTTTPDKRRKVTPTFTWTQGTESATPVEPATPSGDVKICAVQVGTGSGNFDPLADEMRDYRVPMGHRTLRQSVHASHVDNYIAIVGGSVVYSATPNTEPMFLRLTTSSGAETIRGWWACPAGGANELVVGVGINFTTTGPSDHTLGLHRWDFGSGVVALRPDAMIGGTGNGYHYFFKDDNYYTSTDGPVWANGYSAGYAAWLFAGGDAYTSGTAGLGSLYLKHEQTNATITEVRDVLWHVVGG